MRVFLFSQVCGSGGGGGGGAREFRLILNPPKKSFSALGCICP